MSETNDIMQGNIPAEGAAVDMAPDVIHIDSPPVKSKPPDDQIAPQTDLQVQEPNVPAERSQSGGLPDLPGMNQKFTNIRNEERVISIDRQRSVETEADEQMNNLLDLLESLRSKKVMTGKVEGVESTSTGVPSAVLKHGEFKIVIPCYEYVEPPADFRDQDPNTVYHYIISKQLGAEIDFIAKGIDQEAGLVVASRKEAMAIRRRQFYYGQDRDGNNLLYEGAVAEARVVGVIRAGIFVELFGVETYIPMTELSYQRMLDAAKVYQNGMRVLVKILKLDRSDSKDIKLTLSVKQTRKNPYDTVFERYTVGNHYIGTVTMVDINGVFVALDGGIDCLCPFPIRGRPLIGSRVTVKIYSIAEDTRRVRGDIIHSSFVLG